MINSDTNVTAVFDQACSYDAATREVSIQAQVTYFGEFREDFPVKVLEVREGQILYELQPCSAATVLNTDVIQVSIDPIPAYIDLDLGKSGFAPGATPEASGVSEIELYFNVVSTSGGGDTFIRITTTDAPEVIVLGDQGWNLNGDDDVDVFASGIGFVNLSAKGGADLISGQGGQGTGPPTSLGLWVSGGTGPDRLVGTDLRNSFLGGEGADTIIAHGGNDWVAASQDADVVRGGNGRDVIFGGSGPDKLNGGQGVDRCQGDVRRDTFRSCEKVRR